MSELRVMIVEDEPVVALDLEQALIELGYEVTGTASSSDAALRLVAERTPDVVLMDVHIHGPIDGVTTAELIRARHDIPILFITANADDATMERAKQVGPHGFLVKPVQIDNLRSTIEIVAHRHNVEQRARLHDRLSTADLDAPPDDAMLIADEAGKVVYISDGALALFMTQRERVMGRPLHDVLRAVDPESSKPLVPSAHEVLESGKASTPRDVALTEGGGPPRVVIEWSAPITTGGRVTGTVTHCRPRVAPQRTRMRLEQTDRYAALGTMAASVAHELNNPLSVVMANAEYLDDQLSEVRGALVRAQMTMVVTDLDDAHAGLADIRSAAARMQRIVGELREFARPITSRSGRANIVHAVEWAVRATTNHFRHHARVLTAFEPVPPVQGDEIRLGQVMVNLIVNAADAIQPGAVDRNTIGISTRLSGDGRVIVEVADSGSGMSETVRSRMFEPYFSTKTHRVGSGLGLAICQGIVRSLGGDVEVDSTPGVGTTVRLLLQIAGAASAEHEVAAAPTTELRGRILVIDDEEMVLRAIARTLRGHTVVCVTRATEALARIDAGEAFDVILSDVMMPELTGFDFYEALRARSPAFCESVLFMTGDASAANADAFFKTVPNPLIAKPFDPRELQEMVQGMLNERTDSRTSDIPDAFLVAHT